jgi:hypothetical protein
MRNSLHFAVAGAAIVAGILSGCTKKPDPSLFDPTWQSSPAPTITSIAPPLPGLAGVSRLTITGTNFSTVIANDIVYFDATPAKILTASATQLVVRAPLLVKDTVQLSIAVLGSQYLSNYVRYKFIASVNPVTLNLGEVPYAVECDTAGNLYASLIAGGTGIGVKKFTPAGVRTDYSPQFSSALNHWSGMKFGPGKALYAVAAGKTFVFRIPPGGGSAVVWANGLAGPVSDIDFDQQGNVWGCGSGGVIVEVKQNLTKKSFPFAGIAASIRVFGTNVYVAAHRDSVVGVWSLPIIGDSLGAEQLYTDFGAHYSGYELSAITFASDGSMFLGTNAPAGVVVVHPGGIYETYDPGLPITPPLAFAWGTGATIYISRGGIAPALLGFTVEATGAPYYGRLQP